METITYTDQLWSAMGLRKGYHRNSLKLKKTNKKKQCDILS